MVTPARWQIAAAIEHQRGKLGFEINDQYDNDPSGVPTAERQKMAGRGKFPVKFNLTRNCSLAVCSKPEESSLKGKRPSGGYYSIIHPFFSVTQNAVLLPTLQPRPKIRSGTRNFRTRHEIISSIMPAQLEYKYTQRRVLIETRIAPMRVSTDMIN